MLSALRANRVETFNDFENFLQGFRAKNSNNRICGDQRILGPTYESQRLLAGLTLYPKIHSAVPGLIEDWDIGRNVLNGLNEHDWRLRNECRPEKEYMPFTNPGCLSLL